MAILTFARSEMRHRSLKLGLPFSTIYTFVSLLSTSLLASRYMPAAGLLVTFSASSHPPPSVIIEVSYSTATEI